MPHHSHASCSPPGPVALVTRDEPVPPVDSPECASLPDENPLRVPSQRESRRDSAADSPTLPPSLQMQHQDFRRSPAADTFTHSSILDSVDSDGSIFDVPCCAHWVSDAAYDRAIKMRLPRAASFGVATMCCVVALDLVAQVWLAAVVAAMVAVLAAMPALMVKLFSKLRGETVDYLSILCVLLLCFEDMLTAGRVDAWLPSCIAISGMQRFGSQRSAPTAIAASVVGVWLCVRAVEEWVDGGLFQERPGLLENCPSLRAETFGGPLLRRLVVVTHFAMIGREQEVVIMQQRRSARLTSRLATAVAEALVQFDLSLAESLVVEAGGAAEQGYSENSLMSSFRSLLTNLRSYRPYLPDALFAEKDVWNCMLTDESQDYLHEDPRQSNVWAAARDEHVTMEPVSPLLSGPRDPRGLWPRRGSLVRAEIGVDGMPVVVGMDGVNAATSKFAETVLQLGQSVQGVALCLGADHIVLSWNTHAPQPGHSHRAAISGIAIAGELGAVAERWGVAVAGGSMLCGAVGTREKLAPVAVGTPVTLVESFVKLSERLRCRCLCDFFTYQNVRCEVVSRVIDSFRLDSLSGDVYELAARRPRPIGVGGFDDALLEGMEGLEHITDARSFYSHGYYRLKQLDPQAAQRRFVQHLQIYPDDAQAQRLLRITHMLTHRPAMRELLGRDTVTYVRQFVGWQDLEKRAEAFPLPRALQIDTDVDYASPRNSPLSSRSLGASSCSSPASVSRQHSMRSQGDLQRVWSLESNRDDGGRRATKFGSPRPSRVESIISVSNTSDDSGVSEERFLRKQLEARIKANEANAASSPTVGREVVDARGRRFVRSQRVLGKGAFGEVCLGMTGSGEFVAMKMVRLPRNNRRHRLSRLASMDSTSSMQDDSAALPIFPFRKTEGNNSSSTSVDDLLQEVLLMSSLRHDNIVGYISSAVVNDHVVIVMEYVPGGSLSTVLHNFDGKLPVSSVQRYTFGILSGLKFLHEGKILHRDIKPHNVLVTAEGNGKLADFGTSANLQERFSSEGVFGTPQYMAPEACQGRAQLASDVWSVGVTVSELLVGKLPWGDAAAQPLLLLGRVGEQGILPDFSTMSGFARDFCEQCCQVSPDLRPNADALLNDPFIVSTDL